MRLLFYIILFVLLLIPIIVSRKRNPSIPSKIIIQSKIIKREVPLQYTSPDLNANLTNL